MCIRALFNHWIVDGRLDVVMFAVHERDGKSRFWCPFSYLFIVFANLLFVRWLACLFECISACFLIVIAHMKWYGGETKERDRMHVLCERERDKKKAMKMDRVKYFWGIKGRREATREASIEWAFGVKLWLYWLCGRYTEVNYKRNMAACNTYTHKYAYSPRDREREWWTRNKDGV